MMISLILAILELIIKLPDIIKTIQEILKWIHDRPIHLRGELLTKLQTMVAAAQLSGDASEIRAFHASLVV